MRNIIEEMQKDLVLITAKRLPKKATILTHCHSNSVVRALIKAKKMGKKHNVICTETRPLYQGVKTAKELSQHRIKTTLIVDSAVGYFMKDIDLVMVGADVICANGDIVNKIGTSIIAIVAREMKIDFFVVSGCYKYDPLTELGYSERIEERPKNEIILPSKLKNVEIRNPAFDITQSKYISAIITECGVVKPKEVKNTFKRKFNIEKNILQELIEK
jgi:ribose 1,5-bisphosphate isomerase